MPSSTTLYLAFRNSPNLRLIISARLIGQQPQDPPCHLNPSPALELQANTAAAGICMGYRVQIQVLKLV